MSRRLSGEADQQCRINEIAPLAASAIQPVAEHQAVAVLPAA